ncbi:MAG: hypothetical protein WCF85_09665 [Rhodospirillaceae bacterium]
MSDPVIFEDNIIKISRSRIEAGLISCEAAEIKEVLITGGTVIEEKVFLSIITAFGICIALVGFFMSDIGELCLGAGLAVATALIIRGKCALRLVTPAGKITVLTHPDVQYVRRLRDLIEQAREV